MERQAKISEATDTAPLCSVIIPHYNDKEGLSACLAALTGQNFPPEKLEIIVIDDCSREDYSDFFRSNFPSAGFYRQPVNRGPGAARNRGIALARGKFLLFTDSDVCPGPSWLGTMMQGFAAGADILCGPVLHGPGLLERLTALTAFGEYLEDQDRFLGHCPTCNFAVRASVMQDFLFDEEVRFAGEDMVLSTRLAAAGYTIRYLGEAWVVHKPRLTVASCARRAFLYGIGFRDSRMRCAALSGFWLHKYLRAASALPLFLIRSAIDIVRLMKHRKRLGLTFMNLPLFVLGIIGTRLCYATGVFWSYTASFLPKRRTP